MLQDYCLNSKVCRIHTPLILTADLQKTLETRKLLVFSTTFLSRPRVEEPSQAAQKEATDKADTQKYDQVADRLKPFLLRKGASWLSAMVNNPETGMRKVLLRKLIEENRFLLRFFDTLAANPFFAVVEML